MPHISVERIRRSCTEHLIHFLAHRMDLRESAFFLKDSIVDDYKGYIDIYIDI